MADLEVTIMSSQPQLDDEASSDSTTDAKAREGPEVEHVSTSMAVIVSPAKYQQGQLDDSLSNNLIIG